MVPNIMEYFKRWIDTHVVQGRLEIDERTDKWRLHLYDAKTADNDINTYYVYGAYDLSKRTYPTQDEADICYIDRFTRDEFFAIVFGRKNTEKFRLFCGVGGHKGCTLDEFEGYLRKMENLTLYGHLTIL